MTALTPRGPENAVRGYAICNNVPGADLMRIAFRLVSWIEAASYLVLLASVLSYRTIDRFDITSTIGPIHGAAFFAYVALLPAAHMAFGWKWSHTLVAFFAAIIPFGVLITERLPGVREPVPLLATS